MSLLKAFVCQMILLGTYKLFLEQIFEDYLVPDELTRNCLVGFVCLLCFGIQLYTEKAADDDNDEAGEDSKSASNSREVASTKKCESSKISKTQEILTETIGSSISTQGIVTKTQTTSLGSERKERVNGIPTFETENSVPITNLGIFAQCHTNTSAAIPNVESKYPEVSASSVQTSYTQETTTITESNGLSETIVCEESDEDEIEIDHFETEKSGKEAKPLVSTEVEPHVPEPVTDIAEESESVLSNGESRSSKQDSETATLKTDESDSEIINETVEESLVSTKVEEIDPYVPEPVTDIAEESECLLSNGGNLSSIQNLETETLKTDESEVKMANGEIKESLNNIDSISSDILEESIKSVIDENEIGNIQEIPVVSQSNERTKDITESLPSTEEVKNTNSVLTKSTNAAEITNKINSETSKIVNAAVSSTISKMKASGEDVCVAPVTIDISFIYACH